MILLLLSVSAISLLLIAFIIDLLNKNSFVAEETSVVLKGIATILIVLFISIGVPVFFINNNRDATIAAYQLKYNTLIYQLESGGYQNVVEYSRKELINEVLDYNETVTRGQILGKNRWVKIFYPQDWDSLPLIRLEDYK